MLYLEFKTPNGTALIAQDFIASVTAENDEVALTSSEGDLLLLDMTYDEAKAVLMGTGPDMPTQLSRDELDNKLQVIIAYAGESVRARVEGRVDEARELHGMAQEQAQYVVDKIFPTE